MAHQSSIQEITVEGLHSRLERGDELLLIDVREPDEYEQSRIEGSTLIPLQTLPERCDSIDPNQEVVVHCKSGGRSAHAVGFLRDKGFAKVFNLRGGIKAWQERFGGRS